MLAVAVAQVTAGVGGWATTVRGVAPYALALAAMLLVSRLPPVRPDGPEVRRWCEALAVAGSLLSIWLVVRFLWALPDGLDRADGYYRIKVAVTSPVGDHNTAAGLLLPAVVAAVLIARDRGRGWIWLTLCSLGVVATLSRGAAVVLATAGLGAWVVSQRKVAAPLSAAAATVLVAVFALARLLGAAPPTAAPVPEGPLGASIVGRIDLALRGAEITRDNLLLGAGFGSFQDLAADLPTPNDHAHQLFAHAAAEGGLVTLAAVSLLVGALLVAAWRTQPSPLRDLSLVGGGALVLHAQVEILGGLSGYEVLVAVLIGLLARVDPAGPRGHPSEATGER